MPSPAAKSAKEVASGWRPLTELVRKDLAQGKLAEWGAFAGDRRGHAVGEGTELDAMAFTMPCVPHVHFTTKPVGSLDPVGEMRAASANR